MRGRSAGCAGRRERRTRLRQRTRVELQGAEAGVVLRRRRAAEHGQRQGAARRAAADCARAFGAGLRREGDGVAVDYDLGPDADALRTRLRALIAEHIPDDFLGACTDDPGDLALTQRFCKMLAADGLLALAWPKEY